MTGAPCKQCPDRVVGCHSSCAAYLAFRAMMDDRAASRLKKAPAEEFRKDGITKALRIRHSRDQFRKKR